MDETKEICEICQRLAEDVSPIIWYVGLKPNPGYRCVDCFSKEATTDTPLHYALQDIVVHCLDKRWYR